MTTGKPLPPDAPTSRELWFPLAYCWLLMLVTFSAPGRESPRDDGSLDVIGLSKLAVRGCIVVALGYGLLRAWGHRRRAVVVWCFAPFAAFLAWSLVTAGWSAFKAVSLGQWGSLVGQVLLAATIALRWKGPADTSAVLRHLCLALIAVSAFLAGIDLFVSHDLSGLNREDYLSDASTGLVHPTSAGATGSLGVVILVACRLLWGWRWTRLLFFPGLLACGTLLMLSHSRMALAMTGAALGLAFLRYTGARTISGSVIAVVLLGIGYLVYDPGLSNVDRGRKELTAYWRRGETDEQMSSLNGRGDLWDAVWLEFTRSPVVGHGYFMTCSNGLLDVWSGPSVRTAHNFVLQVAVSTGLIGLALFTWAMVRPLRATARELIWGDAEAGRLGAFLLLLGLWYLGWGQLCESFMGPVQPESVVFYCLFGLAVGQVNRIPGTTNAVEGNG